MTNDRPKPGYEQPGVGVIPEDWEVALISELTSEVGDGIHATPLYSNNGDYYFVNGNNLLNGTIVINQDTKRAEISEFRKYRKNLTERSILLSINGTIGNLAFYRNEPIILGKSAAYLNVRNNISTQFFYYALQTRNVEDFFEDGLTGTTIRNLGLGTIRNTPIDIPGDYGEQRSISQVLSDVDALIAGLDKAIDKKRAIKTATMQQLLTGKKRLPGFGEGKGDRQTEVGVIPEDWDVSLLSELTSELGDGIHATPIYSNGEYYFVNGNNLFNGRITISLDTRKVGILEFRKYRKNLSNRSILMSINGTIGNLAYYRDEPIILGKSAAYLNIKKEFSKRFIYFSLQTESVEQFFRDGLTGTTIRNLGLVTIRNTPISIPRQYEEQRAIATVLSDMDTEIAALETRLAKTQSIKQGMMQQLLTGKVRLKIKAGMDAGREDD